MSRVLLRVWAVVIVAAPIVGAVSALIVGNRDAAMWASLTAAYAFTYAIHWWPR